MNSQRSESAPREDAESPLREASQRTSLENRPSEDRTVLLQEDRPVPPQREFSNHKSHSSKSSDFDNSTSLKSNSSDFKGFQPPTAPQQPGTRESYLSHFSDYSGHIDSVDDLGELPGNIRLVGNDEKEIDVGGSKYNIDISDLTSEASSVQLGKLPTIKQKVNQHNQLQPDYSYSTNIEGSVPARSPRRPKSEIIGGDVSKHLSHEFRTRNKHRKHKSLAISDDLDALMKSASNLQEDPKDPDGVEEQAISLSESRNTITPHTISVPLVKTKSFKSAKTSSSRYESSIELHSRTSSKDWKGSEDFQQVSEPGLFYGKPRETSGQGFYTKPRETSLPSGELPPRPSKDNIIKAREVSLQRQRSELGLDEQGLDDSTVDGVDSESVVHNPDFNRELSIEPYSPQESREILDSKERPFAGPEPFENPATERRSVSTLETPQIPNKAIMASPATNKLSVTSKYSDDKKPEDSPRVIMSEYTHENTHENSGIPPPTDPTPPGDFEDEYYDIGEPVLVHKLPRAKSVKDSTVKPKQKRNKNKPKASKRKSSHDLKPFSYSTLINLLESMNGTIIGEEFSQLNLPIKEKQLIEKIVDSLSRLTLDMVLDASRYEIGIQRLEKALRVLEGFM